MKNFSNSTMMKLALVSRGRLSALPTLSMTRVTTVCHHKAALTTSATLNAATKQLSNTDSPHNIRKTWSRPSFPVDKLTQYVMDFLSELF